MTQYLQLHALTFYPPSNLNRDDSGRPKTASVGGSTRIRISSQCLKRSWRNSAFFQNALQNHLAKRTKKVGTEVHQIFLGAGIDPERATKWAKIAAACYGTVTEDKRGVAGNLETSELVFFSDSERQAIHQLAKQLAAEQREPSPEDFQLLKKDHQAVDISLFGRMLASHAEHNVEAAAQVAHAFTVNKAAVEDDFFSAVDELQSKADTGAGHIDEAWYGSGVYYIYICINLDLLLKNLHGNKQLALDGLRALTEAALRVSPSGKQNSFAALSPAGYALLEFGSDQPRSLAYAFLKPVSGGENLLNKAIEELQKTRKQLDQAYGYKSEAFEFSPFQDKGSIGAMLDFVPQQWNAAP